MICRLLIPLIVLLNLHLIVRAQAETPAATIVTDAAPTPLERYAAQEVRRYVYVRTGTLLAVETATGVEQLGDRIVVATSGQPVVQQFVDGHPLQDVVAGLQPEQYLLQTIERDAHKIVLVVGGDGVGTLYGAYRLAEHAGIRFYLHGDVVPDERVSFAVPTVKELGKPLFQQRGIQPFHDFPEGPDWWNRNDYKAIFTQLPKLRMNFFGLHTYPEGSVGPEPLVWIGPPGEIGEGGRVLASYPSRHFVTQNVTSAWGYQPQATSQYAFGAGAMFARDNYGADYMAGTHPWTEMDQPASNALLNRVADVLEECFTFGRSLGVRMCVGTETPLVIPQAVRSRLEAAGQDPDDPQTVQLVYEGMFRRIKDAYPIDYYWLWTPENWTWQEVKPSQIDATLADFAAAERAARRAEVSFQLATCGWVLGPPQDPALFDRELPKSWPVSCINRNVGHDPVEPGFSRVAGRPQWAIPWLEDDPAMIIPQLWVGRMRKDAADALRYGCDGLLGIHWRTRILGPNVAALARASWSQERWKTPAVDQNPPALEGSFDDRRTDYPSWRVAPCDDFYLDWSVSQFGQRAGPRIAPLLAGLDGNLPRPSTWVNGPGGIVPDPRPWREVLKEYGFVDQLRELRPLVVGPGNQERFDYWLNNFRYLRALAKLNCTWAELNAAVESMTQTQDPSDRQRLAERKVIPLRIRLIRELTYVQEYLLQTITTKGGMGNVANWQQHVLPMLLSPSQEAILAATGEPPSGLAALPREYPGPARLFVPVVRTALAAGEPLELEVVAMGFRPVVARLFWRRLGAEQFQSKALTHVARGVYRVELAASHMEGDLEYYIELTADRQQLRFPATAPTLNQTVVQIPPLE